MYMYFTNLTPIINKSFRTNFASTMCESVSDTLALLITDRPDLFHSAMRLLVYLHTVVVL